MTLKQQIQDALAIANGGRTVGVLTFDRLAKCIWSELKSRRENQWARISALRSDTGTLGMVGLNAYTSKVWIYCHETYFSAWFYLSRKELLSLFLPDNAPPVAYELLESILAGGNEAQLRAAIADACEEQGVMS